jgi:hypothetical protein
MGSIKLKHTSGNGTIIHSPAANPTSDVTLKLPSTTGSAGQVLKVASANHSSTNAELEFGGGGKFASYAIIGDHKSADSDAGTFTAGSWDTRDLNTELSDPDGIVSISSNQFTLAAGSYLVKASAPAIGVNNHKIKIYNVTDSADVEIGTTEYSHASDYTGERSFVTARFTISGSKAFEIRHRCETTKSTYGLGRGYGMSVVELFTLVEIYKEA